MINIKKTIAFAVIVLFIFGMIPQFVHHAYAAGGLVVSTYESSTNAEMADALLNELTGTGVEVSNIKFTGNILAAGTFSGGEDIVGFDSGIILSTGKASDVVGPNNVNNKTTDWSNGCSIKNGDPDLSLINSPTYDAAVLEFDFVPQSDTISFQYVFSSEEYNEYANTDYNDVFAFYINKDNKALIPNTIIPVSINNVNKGNIGGDGDPTPVNEDYYIDNSGGSLNIQMDGLTRAFSVNAPVNQGVVNHIKLAIADVADGSYDSNVFIKAGSLNARPAQPGKIGVPDRDGCTINISRTEGSDGYVAATFEALDSDKNLLGSPYTAEFKDGVTSAEITVPENTEFIKLTDLTGGAVADGLAINSEISIASITDIAVQDTPTFSPAAGSVAFGAELQIISAGADHIYYTINGDEPAASEVGSTFEYDDSARPVISSAVTVKAIATKTGKPDSAVGSAIYTQAASADLTDIALSGTPSNYIFAGGTYTYNSVTVPCAASSITVTPTGAGAIKVEGTGVNSGQASDAIPLTAGVEKTITVTVTESGKSTKSYVINVTRSAALNTLVPSGNAPGYLIGGGPKEIDPGLILTGDDLSGADVYISSGFDTGDLLNFINQNGITGSYNAGTGVLTLSGSATAASYQTALRSITFSTSSGNTAQRKVVFSIGSASFEKTMSVVSKPSITAVPSAAGNYVGLSWLFPLDNYRYMVHKKNTSDESGTFQTIPLKSDIKVLNIYPDIGGSDSLAAWMNTYGNPAGSSMTVDKVSIASFNGNPDFYLKNGTSDYYYDVIFFGAWDSNNGKDLNIAAQTAVENYIKAGFGCLFGHDTVILTNFKALAEKYLNMQINSGSYGMYGDTTVRITKKGYLMNYPWSVGDVGTLLSTPMSHAIWEFAMGDIWFKYTSDTFGSADSEINISNSKAGTNNFYLTTWNNCGMIQTGHSNGQATDDEQKILANTLFYLAQLSTGSSFDDHSSQDVAAPDAVTNVGVNLSGNAASRKANVTFDTPSDNGSSYDYYVDAIDGTGTKISSSTVSAVITTGLMGYAVKVDQTPDTDPGSTVNSAANGFTSGVLSNGQWYVHINAIDNAGNTSSTVHYSFTVDTTCTVTFDAEGGIVDSSSQTKYYGSSYGKGADGTSDEALPVPTRTGYTFGGWYDGDNGTGSLVTGETEVTNGNNHNLYAKWNIISYTVSFNSNGGNPIADQSVNYGGNAVKPSNPARSGYTFAGWYIDNTYTTQFSFSNAIAGTMTLYAKWILTENDSSGSTPAPVSGRVIDGGTGSQVSNIEASVTANSSGSRTISMDAAETVVLKDPAGNANPVSDISKIDITSDTGTPVTVTNDGKIEVENLAKGTDTKFEITYDLGNGQKITIGTMEISVDENGNVDLTVTLIDPYGVITDEDGNPVSGVNLTLYYADTDKNKTAGVTPGTIVNLPIIDGFKPNDNRNPQTTDASGAYGFMVYPDTDYYIVAQKDGFGEYTSPTISVGKEIVKWDIKMNSTKVPDVPVITSPISGSNWNGTVVIKGTGEAGDTITIYDNGVTIGSTIVGADGNWSLTPAVPLTEGTHGITAKQTNKAGNTGESSDTLNLTIKKGLERIYGQDRIDTALEIAKSSFSGTVTNVILATAENYPDALAGSVLAYKLNAPILLVGCSDNEQAKVLSYMKDKMDPKGTVYILGGTGAVSTGMEDKVKDKGFKNIKRLGGADRYETAARIAEEEGVLTGMPVVIVSGENYPDALSVSSTAAVRQYPILLVTRDGISDPVKSELTKINPSKVYIIGLQGVVGKSAEDEIAQILSMDRTNILRIGGSDRFKTSLETAKYFDMQGDVVCVATGNNFPDALAGSVYAALNNAPIILADSALSDDAVAYLKGKDIYGAAIFGGEGAVGKGIEDQLSQISGQ